MAANFLHVFTGEWIKTRRTLAFWMVVCGAFFTPAIIVIARLINYPKLTQIYAAEDFWNSLWKSSWESMAIFFLPLGAILSTSLITQIEWKNNTWKQLHTLPVSFTSIFFAKLAVVLVLMFQFLVLFNLAIFLSAVIPWLTVRGTSFPSETIPYSSFAVQDLLYFVDTLPIVALQYLISLRSANFLVPVGIGFMLWVGALASLSSRFGEFVPYTYTMYNYLMRGGVETKAVMPAMNIHLLAIGWFAAFTAAGYLLYLTKREKG